MTTTTRKSVEFQANLGNLTSVQAKLKDGRVSVESHAILPFEIPTQYCQRFDDFHQGAGVTIVKIKMDADSDDGDELFWEGICRLKNFERVAPKKIGDLVYGKTKLMIAESQLGELTDFFYGVDPGDTVRIRMALTETACFAFEKAGGGEDEGGKTE